MKEVLIFGGTSEGRQLAEAVQGLPVHVSVSVATSLGAEELGALGGIIVYTGRRDRSQMAEMLTGTDLCVDATHPYAVEATKNIRMACEDAGVRYVRLLRETDGTNDAADLPERGTLDCHEENTGEHCEDELNPVFVSDSHEAAERLIDTEGNILLTTGTKDLESYRDLPAKRLYARVLPVHESISACERLGLEHSHILALQGPFTEKMNEAMLEQYQIAWMVTKDSGAAGGVPEKLSAAKKAGCRTIVICRPKETGVSLDMAVKLIRSLIS